MASSNFASSQGGPVAVPRMSFLDPAKAASYANAVFRCGFANGRLPRVYFPASGVEFERGPGEGRKREKCAVVEFGMAGLGRSRFPTGSGRVLRIFRKFEVTGGSELEFSALIGAIEKEARNSGFVVVSFVFVCSPASIRLFDCGF